MTATASVMATLKVTVPPTTTVPLPAVIEVPEVPMEATVGAVVSIFNVPAGFKPAAPERIRRCPRHP